VRGALKHEIAGFTQNFNINITTHSIPAENICHNSSLSVGRGRLGGRGLEQSMNLKVLCET
jgi:hypothetical protein